MSDEYWNRMATLGARLQAGSETGNEGSDADLIAHLTQPRPGESEYLPPAVPVRAAAVPGDALDVPVRIYGEREGASGRPLLIWCHGGAFVGGDLEMPEADAVAREIAQRADAVVVSIDYRLCTGGVHFPAPSDDAIAVFTWAAEHVRELGVEPERISIGGASAGACLAAGLALQLRDMQGAQPAAVVLAYPVVHPVLPEAGTELSEKLVKLGPAMAFSPEIIEPVMENYLGTPASDAPAYAAPGIADDLSLLPPTLIINCEYDGLRASGERYAEQLRTAGVAVDVLFAPDVAHGHLNRPGLPQAQDSLTTIAAWVSGQTITTHSET